MCGKAAKLFRTRPRSGHKKVARRETSGIGDAGNRALKTRIEIKEYIELLEAGGIEYDERCGRFLAHLQCAMIVASGSRRCTSGYLLVAPPAQNVRKAQKV